MNNNPDDQTLLKAINQRYTDAYRVAKLTKFSGSVLKLIGKFMMGFLTLFGLAMGSIMGSWEIALLLGFGALAFGSIFFLFGIHLGALGQCLMVNIDCAVCSSPFLTNRLKAITMALPVNEPQSPDA